MPLSHAANGRRQIGDNAAAPSGVGTICKHATAAFHDLKLNTSQLASRVTVGGKKVWDACTAAFEAGGVSGEEKGKLEEQVAIAEADGMFPLRKIGDTPFYAVYNGGSRLVEHNRVHVKHRHLKKTTGSRDT